MRNLWRFENLGDFMRFWYFPGFPRTSPYKFSQIAEIPKNHQKLIGEFWIRLAKINTILRITLQKFENVWRNLAEFLNAERCRTCRAECLLHHRGTCFASQAYIFWISAAPTRTVRAACIVHLLFATPLGLAASLRPDGFDSGAVSFVRRTLARSAFLGFQIGDPRCKSV